LTPRAHLFTADRWRYVVVNYVPVLTSLVWIVFIIGLFIIFRKPLTDRIMSGTSIEVGVFKLGPLVTDTADVRKQEPIEEVGNPDQLKLPFKVQGSDWKKSRKPFKYPMGVLCK
jgi:hypothetical protein